MVHPGHNAIWRPILRAAREPQLMPMSRTKTATTAGTKDVESLTVLARTPAASPSSVPSTAKPKKPTVR